ncbi:MAG: histidinol-phosphate transaminase [Candidatus Micrarchaeia archaeon]
MRKKIAGLARKEVMAIAPYATPPVTGAKVKLNQNESPFDVPPQLKALLQEEVARTELNRYPDAASEELRVELASYAGSEPENIVVGNGADELIYYIALAFFDRGESVVFPAPSFAMYEIAVKLMGCRAKPVLLEKDFSLPERFFSEARNAKVVFLCSPNNPTGNSVPNKQIKEIAAGCRGLVVVDEAYAEFAPQSCLPLVKKFDNLVVLRTFSKAFSAAGIRVGYAVASEEAAGLLNRVRLPWNVSAFSQRAALTLLRHRQLFVKNIERIVRERDRVAQELTKIRGVRVFPSDANFYLFSTPASAQKTFTSLWERGILVRDVSTLPLLAKCLRANVGTEDENDEFVDALREVAEGESWAIEER